MNNKEVAQAWAESRPGRSGRMKTDGFTLWSYQMPIGKTDDNGVKVVLPFRGVSTTTSMHGGLAESAVARLAATKQEG